VSLAFATVAELLRNEMEKVVASERSKTLLLQEVAHRTKNNLAMLSAMVRLQSRTLGPVAIHSLPNTLSITSERQSEIMGLLQMGTMGRVDVGMDCQPCTEDSRSI
jgi:two-component sensor histidine kinase